MSTDDVPALAFAPTGTLMDRFVPFLTAPSLSSHMHLFPLTCSSFLSHASLSPHIHVFPFTLISFLVFLAFHCLPFLRISWSMPAPVCRGCACPVENPNVGPHACLAISVTNFCEGWTWWFGQDGSECPYENYCPGHYVSATLALFAGQYGRAG